MLPALLTLFLAAPPANQPKTIRVVIEVASLRAELEVEDKQELWLPIFRHDLLPKSINALAAEPVTLKVGNETKTVSVGSRHTVAMGGVEFTLHRRYLSAQVVAECDGVGLPASWNQPPASLRQASRPNEAPNKICIAICTDSNSCKVAAEAAAADAPGITFEPEIKRVEDDRVKGLVAFDYQLKQINVGWVNKAPLPWTVVPNPAAPNVVRTQRVEFIPAAIERTIDVDERYFREPSYVIEMVQRIAGASCVEIPNGWRNQELDAKKLSLFVDGNTIETVPAFGQKRLCLRPVDQTAFEKLVKTPQPLTHRVVIKWNEDEVVSFNINSVVEVEDAYVLSGPEGPRIESYGLNTKLQAWMRRLCVTTRTPFVQGAKLDASDFSVIDDEGNRVVEFSGLAGLVAVDETKSCANITFTTQAPAENSAVLATVRGSQLQSRQLTIYFKGKPRGKPIQPNANYVYFPSDVAQMSYAIGGLTRSFYFRDASGVLQKAGAGRPLPENMFSLRAQAPLIGLAFGVPEIGGLLETGVAFGTVLGTDQSSTAVGMSLGVYAAACVHTSLNIIARICGVVAGDGFYVSNNFGAAPTWLLVIGTK